MYKYIFIAVYMYIYTYTDIYTYTHTDIHTYAQRRRGLLFSIVVRNKALCVRKLARKRSEHKSRKKKKKENIVYIIS